MSILFENCDLLLRGEDGGYSTLHGFLGVRGDTIDYIGTEKPTGAYEEHKSMEHKLFRYVFFPRRDGRRRRGSGHEGKHQPLRAVL